MKRLLCLLIPALIFFGVRSNGQQQKPKTLPCACDCPEPGGNSTSADTTKCCRALTTDKFFGEDPKNYEDNSKITYVYDFKTKFYFKIKKKILARIVYSSN